MFTHDLDFTTLLAPTRESGPSALQACGRNVLSEHLGPAVVAVRRYEAELEQGSLVVVDVTRAQVRILPL